mmetsp:Transcript_23709/g.68181  ORF Transcript_23709/g.68181 Transcript_23709/m.68181 type:complete len:210 (-) Transcript_23709:266-895(-)
MVADLHREATVERIESRDLLRRELKVERQVRTHALGAHGLRDGGVALLLRPPDQHLRGADAQPLGRLQHRLSGRIGLPGAERAVTHHGDALRQAPLREVPARVGGVDLQLVHRDRDLGVGEQVGDLQARPIRHPDRLRLACSDQRLHVRPQLVHRDLCSYFAALRVQARIGIDADGRVHEVQVHIVELQVPKGLVARGADLVPVRGPEL